MVEYAKGKKNTSNNLEYAIGIKNTSNNVIVKQEEINDNNTIHTIRVRTGYYNPYDVSDNEIYQDKKEGKIIKFLKKIFKIR